MISALLSQAAIIAIMESNKPDVKVVVQPIQEQPRVKSIGAEPPLCKENAPKRNSLGTCYPGKDGWK